MLLHQIEKFCNLVKNYQKQRKIDVFFSLKSQCDRVTHWWHSNYNWTFKSKSSMKLRTLSAGFNKFKIAKSNEWSKSTFSCSNVYPLTMMIRCNSSQLLHESFLCFQFIYAIIGHSVKLLQLIHSQILAHTEHHSPLLFTCKSIGTCISTKSFTVFVCVCDYLPRNTSSYESGSHLHSSSWNGRARIQYFWIYWFLLYSYLPC